MRLIPLTQGKFAKVDDEDYERINAHKWYFGKKGYAARLNSCYMHREIMNTPDGMDTDHIDHDKLNNCKSNLRICDRHGNRGNAHLSVCNKSGFKGVRRHHKKWVAEIHKSGRTQYLGLYSTPEEAAQSYDKAAIQYFGDFAKLNLG